MTKLGEKVKALLTIDSLSMTEIASMCGCSQAAVSYYAKILEKDKGLGLFPKTLVMAFAAVPLGQRKTWMEKRGIYTVYNYNRLTNLLTRVEARIHKVMARGYVDPSNEFDRYCFDISRSELVDASSKMRTLGIKYKRGTLIFKGAKYLPLSFKLQLEFFRGVNEFIFARSVWIKRTWTRR